MAQWIQMDPKKRDYIMQKGSPVPSDRIEEATYFALLIPKNNWLYGESGQGSLLYTLENIMRDGAVEQEYAGYVEDAVQNQLISTGIASAVGVTNLQATRTGTNNQISVVPTAKPVQSQFAFTPV